MNSHEMTQDEVLLLAEKDEFSHVNEILLAYAKVLPLRESVRFDANFKPADFPEKELNLLLLNGQAAKLHGKFQLDLNVLRNHAGHFLDLFSDINPEVWEINREYLKSSEKSLVELFTAFIEEKMEPFVALVKEDTLSLPVLASFVQQVLKGWMMAFRDVVLPLMDLKRWRSGFCPVCGAYAAFGKVDEGRRRTLYCSFCETEYTYPWGNCPVCMDSTKEISLLKLPDRAGYMIALCSGCNSFIKHVDSTKLKEIPKYPLIDIATIDIDLQAQMQGYIKPALSSFGY